jgi:UTP--glucose-1-phosphate uridylyltransferase
MAWGGNRKMYKNGSKIKIKKAVIPIAGCGTRFSPITKTIPKEMLPIIDKPLIQFAIDESIASGIEQLIFISNENKRAIDEYLIKHFELQEKRNKKDKNKWFCSLTSNLINQNISFTFIRQPKPLGLGHAVLCARPIIGDEPFAVVLPDDFIGQTNNKFCLQQMIEKINENIINIVAVEEINVKDVTKYGIVKLFKLSKGHEKIEKIIEKPELKKTLSNLGVVGRYIFSSEIFSKLKKTKPKLNGEIQLTDAIGLLLKNESIFTHRLTSKRYDCGNKFGYLKAVVDCGLEHPEFCKEFACFLKKVLKKQNYMRYAK